MSNTTEKQVFVDKNLQKAQKEIFEIITDFFATQSNNDTILALNELLCNQILYDNKSVDIVLVLRLQSMILEVENKLKEKKDLDECRKIA
jgi:hypothetical protein